MVLKLGGALLLVFATGSTGYLIARNFGDRVALLMSLQSLLQFLITEIDFALTPFPQALKRAGHSLEPSINSFVHEVLSGMEAGKTLCISWEEGVRTLLKYTPLEPDDIKPLTMLSPILGLSDRKDQLRHLKIALEHLRLRQNLAEADAVNNQKLWRYSGVLAGLVVVLLLI